MIKMDWNTIFNLIDPALLIVVAACWALGYSLKKTPHVADWSIVYIVVVFAVIVVVWMQGINPQSVLQGILCGAVAVLGHQMLKQGKEGAVGG
jgi:FtsH-binding integral membrane protein